MRSRFRSFLRRSSLQLPSEKQSKTECRRALERRGDRILSIADSPFSLADDASNKASHLPGLRLSSPARRHINRGSGPSQSPGCVDGRTSSWRGISVCICLTCVPSSGHKAGTVTGSACGQLRKQVPFGNCVVESRTQTNNTPDHSDRGSACGAAAHRPNPNNGNSTKVAEARAACSRQYSAPATSAAREGRRPPRKNNEATANDPSARKIPAFVP
jgi:hypothetical protein